MVRITFRVEADGAAEVDLEVDETTTQDTAAQWLDVWTSAVEAVVRAVATISREDPPAEFLTTEGGNGA